MAKRIQQESGEERVTAKSRPMRNLTARMPSVVLSSTSSSQGKTRYGYQDPVNMLWKMIDQGNLMKLLGMRCNKFVFIMETLLDGNAQSVRYGGMLHDRSGQLDNANSQEVPNSETFVMGRDAAEFANKVKDQVR